jgi:hypothetical protein
LLGNEQPGRRHGGAEIGEDKHNMKPEAIVPQPLNVLLLLWRRATIGTLAESLP